MYVFASMSEMELRTFRKYSAPFQTKVNYDEAVWWILIWFLLLKILFFFYLESVIELHVIPSSRYGAKMDTVLLFTFSLSFKYM